MQKLSTRQFTDLASWRAVRPAGFIRSLKAIIGEIQRARPTAGDRRSSFLRGAVAGCHRSPSLQAAMAWAKGETVMMAPVVISTINPRSAPVMSR